MKVGSKKESMSEVSGAIKGRDGKRNHLKEIIL